MQLGPLLFTDAPALPTFTLSGEPLSGGQLLFAPDERHLLVLPAGGGLDVWDLAARRQVARHRDLTVWGVAPDPRGGGLLLAVEDGDEVRVVRTAVDGSSPQTVIGGLPGMGTEEYVCLAADSERALVATRRWARWCDLGTGRVTGGFDPLPAVGQQLVTVRGVSFRGVWHLRVVGVSSADGAEDWTQSVWSEDRVEVARLGWRLPGLRLEIEVPAVVAGPAGAVAVLDDGLDLLRVRPLDGYAPGMHLFRSLANCSWAGVREDRLAVWRNAELVSVFGCDGVWGHAWPSDDGRRVALVYNPGHLPNPGGVLDLPTGRVVGRCDVHVMTTLRGFSGSNQYLVSVMTDNDHNRRSGQGSGTIVVTELPPLG
jgi:hypothetical protein